MRTILQTLAIVLCLVIITPSSAKAQASCAAAYTLTPNAVCSPYTGNLKDAIAASVTSQPAGACGGATAATTYGVWFKFTATNATAAITISNVGTNITPAATYVELLSGSCGSFTSLGCQNITTRLVYNSLTPTATYYIRVYTTSPNTTNPTNKWNFDICVTSSINDNCSGAQTLTPNTGCTNVSGTLDLSTSNTTGLPVGCEPAGTLYDVWFKFNATSTTQLVTISSLGVNISNPSIQLYSGLDCNSLSSIACGTTSVASASLVVGAPYYIRVSNVGSNPTGATGADFQICVSSPTAAKVDYSKSYINVTKGSTGGTVNPGDTLELRFNLVVSSKTLDSLSIRDTLYNTKGLRLVPGSLILRTNEGKAYKTFTDAIDADAGWYSTNGLDTIIRINFGTGASNVARGQLTNTSRPSVFGSTCIIMATYRAVVYAPYNTLINFKTGALTYKDQATTMLMNQTFAPNNLVVYQSPGLCPNAVSATNALGAEFNGTFGSPSTTPLARNRGTTPYTSYMYGPFNSAAGSPQDYYYGITNNTSGVFTTTTTWLKPDANKYRIFDVWDITGDHTGTNNATGNPPCDTTKPKSASNPCGYMLVINSAYRADTAFTYTVNNLCPNTYYEISAWFKNMCYKCGCDSTGAGVTAVGYIPSAPGDSSGVQPNIAFDVNGKDYYTTGNIAYTGTTPTNSDATNKWVKKGFVYLTGPAENTFTLTLRNNAPGGGGNDWALDDISVATCLPNMQYSPSLSPVTCNYNPVTINDTVRSYSNNYNNYKWQRSTNGGTSWTDVAGATGSSTPSWNGSAYEYVTSYTITPANTGVSNNGDRYRVVVSTTTGNLANSNCQVTDGISIINLQVLDCNNPPPLKTDLLSFKGVEINKLGNLFWTTDSDGEKTDFEIEKSKDAILFQKIRTVSGLTGSGKHSYSFVDSVELTGKTYYRIALVTPDGKRTYSRTVILRADNSFNISNLTSPFSNAIWFTATSDDDARIDVSLLDMSGTPVRQQSISVLSGMNSIKLPNLEGLSSGMYILKIRHRDQVLSYKVVRK